MVRLGTLLLATGLAGCRADGILVSPPTTLLPFGTTTVEISVSPGPPNNVKSCWWRLASSGTSGTLIARANKTFGGTVTGLVSGANNVVTVGCGGGGGGSTTVVYRDVPDIRGGSYPKTGVYDPCWHHCHVPHSSAGSPVRGRRHLELI